MGNGRNDQTEMDRKILKNTHEDRGVKRRIDLRDQGASTTRAGAPGDRRAPQAQSEARGHGISAYRGHGKSVYHDPGNSAYRFQCQGLCHPGSIGEDSVTLGGCREEL